MRHDPTDLRRHERRLISERMKAALATRWPGSRRLLPDAASPNGIPRLPRTGNTDVLPNAQKHTRTAHGLGWRASGNYIKRRPRLRADCERG